MLNRAGSTKVVLRAFSSMGMKSFSGNTGSSEEAVRSALEHDGLSLFQVSVGEFEELVAKVNQLLGVLDL